MKNKKGTFIKLLLIALFFSGCFQDAGNFKRLAEQSEALYKQSVAGYERILARRPADVTARLALARLYSGHGDYDMVIEVLKDTDERKAKELLAICFYKSGDYTQALTLFDRIGKEGDAEYLYYYGLTAQKHNLYEQALEVFGRIKDREYSLKAKARIDAISGLRGGFLDPALKEEIAGITQEQYPLAGAAIILVDENMTLSRDNTLTSESRYMIKILNERGKQDFSEVVIGYDSTYEKVEVEYARTIKPGGEVVMVGEKDIRDVSRYLNFPLYSNARARIISMPEITIGAIIEYKIKTTQSQLINKKDFDLAYSLQESEPVISAKFAIRVPKERELKIKILNPEYNLKNFNLSPGISETPEERIYAWDFKNIPQIEIEPNMPPMSEINPIIMMSTFESWKEIYTWWRDLVKDRIVADKAISDKAKELIKGKAGGEDKIRALYNYCAQEIRYVGVEYGQAGYQPHMASEIFKNKYGDCKDKAILFITMLKEAGIEGYPVLIGTRGTPATLDDFPAVNFNHAIAAVELDGKLIFLDITAEVCSFGDLPEDDQQRHVVVFKKDGFELVDTPLLAPQDSRVKSHTKISIASDESISAQRQVETFGQFDQAQRYWLRYTPPNLIEQGLKEKIQDIVTSGNLIKYAYENAEDLNLPIKLNYSFTGKNFFSRAGAARILPQFTQLDTSIVAKDIRNYPLELGQPNSTESYFEIELPAGLEVKYLPEGLKAETPWMDYSVGYALEARTLKVRQAQALKSREVSRKDYPEFKKFLEDLSVKMDEHVVLEKKNGPAKNKR